MKTYLRIPEINQELLNSIFNYEDGHLFYKNGIPVKYSICKKYRRAQVNKLPYDVHAIIYLMHHGYVPIMIDHKDNNQSNNLISNLRPSNSSQNSANRRAKINGKSMYLGVSKNRSKWAAELRKDKKSHWLGRHITEESAALAYNRAAVFHHGEFANLNIIQPK